jgi:hypothetical protein
VIVSELSNEKELAEQQLNKQVVCIRNIAIPQLQVLLEPYGLVIEMVDSHAAIPGSFWGDEEAGLINNSLYVQPETPVHSALHEACHYICMDPQRRSCLDTNAGGDYDEENAVCYLQVLLADHLPPLNKTRMMADMDAWGYSFRLGSTSRWFYEDAEDARNWLIKKGIITDSDILTWELCGN